MANLQAASQRMIAALGQHLGTELRLDEGVCALHDLQGKEAVIIEIPSHSDSAILHCQIDTPPHSPSLHKRLLELNFKLDVLRGCWLAIDDQGQVRLCAHCALDMLDETTFCHWVVGFIAQVGDVRALVQAGPAARPLPPPMNMTRTRLG
jgi:hypothetical protein